MARSTAFRSFERLMAAALLADNRGYSATDAVGALQELTQAQTSPSISRRQFLLGAGTTGATLALGTITGFPLHVAEAKPVLSSFSVGIVGAGLAGLTCADRLKTQGIRASVYEAATRTGGRCWSLRDHFPGQVADRGGEFIDNLHKTMLGYAKRFRLSLEDVNKEPGDVFYHFHGQSYSEAAVVAEFRDFVSAMRTDLNRLSQEVTAAVHTPDDVTLDRISLLAYLEGHNGAGVPAGPLAKAAIIAAYEAEYGLAVEEQGCLAFLLFIHADRRSKFTPFGVFSDERYHVVDGNDRITEGLARELPGQITYGSRLVRIRKSSDGRIELTFQQGPRTVTFTHDATVLAIPFTILREIELDPSLKIPAHQLTAIQELGYGTNAKMMIGFSSRHWRALGSKGAAYSNLAHVQTTWETNPSQGTATRGVLTDYSSSARGAGLNPKAIQTEAHRFLTDLNYVFPGSLGAATLIQGQYLAHLEHWPSSPFVKGSYSCYKPGQFTTIAGLEGLAVENLFFAGEHTNSFYEWQGFMEGAALSGIAAAQSIFSMARTRL